MYITVIGQIGPTTKSAPRQVAPSQIGPTAISAPLSKNTLVTSAPRQIGPYLNRP